MARPKKDEDEVVVTLSASVLPGVAAKIKVTADEMERSKSWLAGKLLVRGWRAFQKDGQLTDEDPTQQAKRTASDKPLQLSQRSIRTALNQAMAFTGEPLSQTDRDIIEQALLEESGNSSTRRKRAKKS